MSIYKGLRYYKYVYEDWTQPVLTANGTMGGDSFAVSASSTHSSVQPYYAFNGVIGAYTTGWTAKVTDAYLQFYNPQPLKISKLTIKNVPTNSSGVGYVTEYTIKASNNPDGDYVDVVSGTNDIGYDGTWDINITTNESYKYWRFYVNSWNNIQWFSISELTITAQEGIPTESTKDDYDYAVPIKILDSGRGVFVGSKNTNCLTYTPKHVDVELNPLNVNVTGTWGVIADGVAKGFSASNYLTYPEVFNISTVDSWEMECKFTTGSNITTQQQILSSSIFASSGNSCGAFIRVYSSKIQFMVPLTSNISSYISLEYTATINTEYVVKGEFTGTAYNLYVNGELVATKESTSKGLYNASYNDRLYIGTATTKDCPFLGSIDLSQSYIKINNELWWSGDSYTKVGSWIDNGVAGSFTSANYVTVPEVLPSEITSSEYVFKITTGASVTSPENQVFISHKSPNTCVVAVRSSTFGLFTGSWVNGVTTVLPNTTYILKTVFDGSSWTLYSSTDGIDWIQEVTWSTTTNYVDTNVYIGRDYDTTGEYFTGTIDLTQSYIKINNEIWWQGGTGDVTLKQGSKVFVPNGFSDYDYYKYVYQDWTQPVLTENGVLGGESFAVACSLNPISASNDIFHAFDRDYSSVFQTVGNTTNPQWVTFYSPNPLLVKSLKIYQYTGEAYYYIRELIVQGSNDNSSWVDLTTWSNSGYLADFTIDLSSNNTGYKYYRLYITSRAYYSSGSSYLLLREIDITAQEGIPNPATPDDYDVKTPKGYKVFNELVIPNDISVQSFANSEQAICYNPTTNRLCFVGNDVYDTANNVMNDNCSLPVAICTANGVSVTSIDETFDWCGRIGNTAFVLPGVKGFIAKGYKDTGTYDSTEFTVNKVLTADLDTVTDRSLLLNTDKLDYVESNYNKVDNLLYNTDGEVINAVECGKVTSDGTAITSLTPYTAQPLTTAIPIKFIYSGSQLVYKWEPYEPNTVLLYGANTGAKTYILDAGLYQCCVVGGGIRGNYWSKAGGSAVEIQFRLTEKATVVVYSGGGSSTGYINIDGVRIATAGGARGQNDGGLYSIDTASPYYVSTIVARNGGGANMSTAGSVSPYGGWGAGGADGGARLEYITY